MQLVIQLVLLFLTEGKEDRGEDEGREEEEEVVEEKKSGRRKICRRLDHHPVFCQLIGPIYSSHSFCSILQLTHAGKRTGKIMRAIRTQKLPDTVTVPRERPTVGHSRMVGADRPHNRRNRKTCLFGRSTRQFSGKAGF